MILRFREGPTPRILVKEQIPLILANLQSENFRFYTLIACFILLIYFSIILHCFIFYPLMITHAQESSTTESWSQIIPRSVWNHPKPKKTRKSNIYLFENCLNPFLSGTKRCAIHFWAKHFQMPHASITSLAVRVQHHTIAWTFYAVLWKFEAIWPHWTSLFQQNSVMFVALSVNWWY